MCRTWRWPITARCGRTNTYVSQYVDHSPLSHPERGVVVASRQNQDVGGRNPWCVIGSLRRGVSFATDALQVHGLTTRAGRVPEAVTRGRSPRCCRRPPHRPFFGDEDLFPFGCSLREKIAILRCAERREVIGAAAEIGVSGIAAERRRAIRGTRLVDRIFLLKQTFSDRARCAALRAGPLAPPRGSRRCRGDAAAARPASGQLRRDGHDDTPSAGSKCASSSARSSLAAAAQAVARRRRPPRPGTLRLQRAPPAGRGACDNGTREVPPTNRSKAAASVRVCNRDRSARVSPPSRQRAIERSQVQKSA